MIYCEIQASDRAGDLILGRKWVSFHAEASATRERFLRHDNKGSDAAGLEVCAHIL